MIVISLEIGDHQTFVGHERKAVVLNFPHRIDLVIWKKARLLFCEQIVFHDHPIVVILVENYQLVIFFNQVGIIEVVFDTLVELEISHPAWLEIDCEYLVLVCHYHVIASSEQEIKPIYIINVHQVVKAHDILRFIREFKLTMLSNNKFTVIGN